MAVNLANALIRHVSRNIHLLVCLALLFDPGSVLIVCVAVLRPKMLFVSDVSRDIYPHG